jgi:predicted SprT family Zn-dependent metalloprotease
MKYPRIKFKADYRKDVQSFLDFFYSASYDEGRSFQWAVTDHYPEFKFFEGKKNITKKEEKQITNFVKKEYKKKEKIIAKNLQEYEDNWKKVEQPFFELVELLFGRRQWPKGKYIAYSTIWGMFPRFLEDKTFQVPVEYKNKKYVNVIIAHELLHFMFYDYFYTQYPRYNKRKEDFFVWNISEIFNVVVQNSSEWVDVFREKTQLYPEHKKMITALAKRYKKGLPSAQTIIEDTIELLKKEKS